VLSKRDSRLQGFELILTGNGNYSTIKTKTLSFYFSILNRLSGPTNYLGSRSIVLTDGLPCFVAVEHLGCGHESIILSGDELEPKRKEFKWENTVIGNVKNSILGTYHAVSAKHLPRYFAEFCYRFNRRFDLKSMVRRLIHALVNNPQRRSQHLGPPAKFMF